LNNQSIRRDFDSTDFEEAKALITWNALVEPGDRIAGELISSLGAAAALEAFLKKVDVNTEVLASYERWSPRYSPTIADEKINLARRFDLKLLLASDPQWPTALSELGAHSPNLLWYRGSISEFSKFSRAVGVVGSRNASHYGQRVTSDLTAVLVQEGATVVSGGALGIDSVAHRTALHLGGKTVAIMAGALDCLYPSANLELFDQIGHRGLLLSEMSPGAKPTRWRFLQRNRLIAALSDALVVTEAGWRSGSINTANHAVELNRRVFAVPGPITNPSSAGCNRLIRDQQADLLLDPADLPEELGWRSIKIDHSKSLGQLELRALDAMTKVSLPIESIANRAGLTLGEARMALASLHLDSLAERSHEGWRRL